MRIAVTLGLAVLTTAASVASQSYDDFRLVRNRPTPTASLFQARLGAAMVIPED